MISCFVKRNKDGEINGFTVENHGDPLLCSAVSTIVINTVNSITELTDTDISIEFDDNGGYMEFQLENVERYEDAHDAFLLLKSLYLGLTSLQLEHPDDLEFIVK